MSQVNKIEFGSENFSYYWQNGSDIGLNKNLKTSESQILINSTVKYNNFQNNAISPLDFSKFGIKTSR